MDKDQGSIDHSLCRYYFDFFTKQNWVILELKQTQNDSHRQTVFRRAANINF
jgi:hypothetical protein